MDEEEQKVCPNCKREIPAVNFTIHTVHCARNIKVCPVCKEPVPQLELEEHHEKLHKLLPCKQCGEKVCGTDLEDHIRDSCGNTIKSCRYCELELPRRELPAHENYCGVRTEQCPECREWVMIKYRQLHLDSNHGFLRLDDDPVPKKDPPKPNPLRATNLPKPTIAPLANITRPTPDLRITSTNTNQPNGPRTEIRYYEPAASSSKDTSPGVSRPLIRDNVQNGLDAPSVSRTQNGQPVRSSSVIPSQNMYNGSNNNYVRTEIPQSSKAMAEKIKVDRNLPGSHGAVKKRPAPAPPRRAPPPDPKRDLAFLSAMQRHQTEEKKREEQNAYNLANGLPPVLSPAAKLEKLRKMDALQNRETEPTDYKSRLQGRVWMDRLNIPIGNVLGSTHTEQASNGHLEAERRRQTNPGSTQRTGELNEEDIRNGLKNVKPMTPQQFMDRFKELQLRKERDDRSERRGDRFSEIKTSLRELRRGLNEVTAPYNSSNSSSATKGERRCKRSPRLSPPPSLDEAVLIPCEFCATPIPAHDLVLHQTGCRPDLAQRRPSRSPSPRECTPAPVIPCEFCTQSLPVYLITEHQERCGRDSNLVYPD